MKYLGNVGMRGQADHNVQFLQLDVDGVIVLDKEHFDLLLQDLRPASREITVLFSVKTFRIAKQTDKWTILPSSDCI